MKYLLIDGNNMACRASFANSELKNKDGIFTGVHYGFFNSLFSLKQKFNDYQMLIVWDGKSIRRVKEANEGVRLNIIPEGYKENRKKDPIPEPLKNFYEQAPYLQRALGETGIPQIRMDEFEADDVIASYVKILAKEDDNEIIVVTSDGDYFQLLQSNVSLWDAMKHKMTYKKEWESETGLAPLQYIDVGALMGDTCLSGNTKISLLNGEEETLNNLYVEKKEFWVYSCGTDGEIVPAKAICKLMSKNTDVVKVRIDNGEDIICTKEHRFMMRDGTYREASKLVNGDSLMPLYRKKYKIKNRNYYKYLNNKTGGWDSIHGMVGNLILKDSRSLLINKIKENNIRDCLVIHHKDFNSFNNDPKNLQWMLRHEHIGYHSSLNKEKWQVSSYREKMKDVCSKAGILGGKTTWEKHRKEMLKIVSKTGRKTGRINITKYNKSEENKPKASKNILNYLKNPEFAPKRKEAAKKRANSFKYRENMANIGRKYSVILNKDPEQIRKQILGKVQKSALRAFQKYGIINHETYSAEKNMGCLSWENAIERYSYEEISKLCSLNRNHKVVSVEYAGKEDVYDVQIIDSDRVNNHNFALSSGIFVHNCDNIFGVPGWGEKTATKEVKKYGTWQKVLDAYKVKYADSRKTWADLKEPLLIKDGYDPKKIFEELSTKKTDPEKETSRLKYSEINFDMPYTGVLCAFDRDALKIKASKAEIMALMFEDRIKLAYSLKKMDDNISNLPCIRKSDSNKNRLLEYFHYYDINTLDAAVNLFE